MTLVHVKCSINHALFDKTFKTIMHYALSIMHLG